MKLFILLAIIAFTTSFPLLGGYESLNIQDARSDAQIQSLIDAGLQKAVEKGLQDGKFSSPNFELYKINSIYKQQGDNGDNYKFDCEYINDEGYTMDAYFEATYNTDNNEIAVTDYSYKVKDYSVIDEIEQLYTQVTYDQFQYSNEIQNIVISGANQFIKYCIEAQTIPNTQYQVSKVNWVYRQVYENSYFYKCNLYIVGRQGNRAEANFTVYYQPLLNKYHLVDYSCIYEDNQAYVVRETVKPIDSYYTPITNIEKNSGTVKDILNYGCEQVTRIASNDGKIPNTQLEVLDFTQANSQIVGNGVYYKFNCKLGDYNGVTLTTWFTVYYDFYASESSLISYSYESDITGNLNQDQETEVSELNEAEFINVPENEEQIPQEEEAEEEESQTPGRLSIFDQVFPLPEPSAEEENEVAIENDQEQVTETEEPGSQSGNQGDIGDEEEEQVTQEEVIIEEIPPSEGQGDWEGYEELSTNQVLYDSETTQVLQYGFDTVLESGQNEGKIPKYQFTITKIERAGKKKQEEGDFYKFKCEADSEEGTVLSLSFTAYYAFNTQEVSMIGYSYEIKNVVPITEVKETIPTDGEYEQYDQGEIKDDDRLQGALDYGIAQIYSYVIQEKKISTSDFSLNEVVSAYKQETVTGWCYKCEVKLEDTSNMYIYANFTVYYASDSGQYALSDYSYNVEESEESGTEEGGSGGNDLYENIDAGAWEYDEYYNDMLLYAINEVIQKGYQSEEIPQSEYKISKIISAEKKQQNDDNYYRCTIELKNTEQVVITLEFTASITITTRSKKLWDWSYGVDNRQTATRTSDLKISDATYTEVDRDYIQYDKKIQDCIIYGADQVIPNPQDYSLLKVRNVYRQVLDNSVYYKYEIDLESEEKNAEFTCTVSYKPYLDNKDVVAYSYKTKPPYSSGDSNPQPDWWGSASWSSSPSSSGSAWSTNYNSIYSYNYQEMGVSDVKGNSKYQEILDYGVKECVEDLYDKKVLESKDYEVDEIVDAYNQEYNNYENCQMGVKLKNKYGAILELNFNVQYESRYEDKTVTSYSAKGYNSDGSEAVIVNYNGEQGGQYEIENCKPVYNEEIETVAYLKDIVDYGVGEVVDKATNKEDIYYKDFEVKKVKNMYRDMADSNKYRVYASLENSEGKKIDCSFCVSYQPKDEKKEVVWYSYITY